MHATSYLFVEQSRAGGKSFAALNMPMIVAEICASTWALHTLSLCLSLDSELDTKVF